MSLRKIIVGAAVAIAAVALLAGTACKSKSVAEQAAENRIERAMEKATGGKVDIDLRGGTMKVQTPEGESVLTTGEQKWPEDLPEGMVKFGEAKVRAVSRSVAEDGKTWTVHLMDVGENALTAFTDKLREEGWTIESAMNMGQGGMVQATKDDLMVNVISNTEEKAAVVTYRQTKET
jgi:hypothetical protein